MYFYKIYINYAFDRTNRTKADNTLLYINYTALKLMYFVANINILKHYMFGFMLSTNLVPVSHTVFIYLS